MSRRIWILAALLSAALVACGDDDASGGGDRDAPSAANGVEASGDGWRATFPGEVDLRSDPLPFPGGDGMMEADSTTWESDSEAVTVVTADFPAEMIAAVDVETLLEGAVRGNDGTVVESSLLDDDGTFRGRPAFVYESPQDDFITTGLAFVDGARLYQVLHVSRDGNATSWESLVRSFEFTN